MRGRACPFPVCTTSEPVETLSLSLSLSQAGHESSSMKPIFTKQPSLPELLPACLCNLSVPCSLHHAGQPCPDCTTSLGSHRHISLQLPFPQPRRGCWSGRERKGAFNHRRLRPRGGGEEGVGQPAFILSLPRRPPAACPGPGQSSQNVNDLCWRKFAGPGPGLQHQAEEETKAQRSPEPWPLLYGEEGPSPEGEPGWDPCPTSLGTICITRSSLGAVGPVGWLGPCCRCPGLWGPSAGPLPTLRGREYSQVVSEVPSLLRALI